MVSHTPCVFLILAIFAVIHVQCRRGVSNGACECGLTGSTNRIVGGWTARAHEYPWIVPIYNRGNMFCGGAIINDRYILTAGHCVAWSNKNDLTIQVGAHDQREKQSDKIYSAKKLILHPEFYSYKLYDLNDIALIKLDRKIQFSHHVRPVCLPELGSKYDNKYATVAGWGSMEEGEHAANKLQETIVKVLSNSRCAETKMKTVLSPTVMCAFKEKSDSCQGDSGGPLIYEREPGKMEQIGVVSWGIGCGSDTPGIYTKVTEYLDWIYRTTADAEFCMDNRK